jgi:ribosomal-protein-alanine N-acetyltransferase
MDAPWRIRPARPADGDRLAVIERRCFGDPWSAAAFEDILVSSGGLGVVAVRRDGPIGYLIGRVAAGEGEILNLAVVPEARRRGVGQGLLEAGLVALAQAGAREIFLEVREHNRTALDLYQRRGFRPVGLRPRYYRNPVEDAIVLRLALEPGA